MGSRSCLTHFFPMHLFLPPENIRKPFWDSPFCLVSDEFQRHNDPVIVTQILQRKFELKIQKITKDQSSKGYFWKKKKQQPKFIWMNSRFSLLAEIFTDENKKEKFCIFTELIFALAEIGKFYDNLILRLRTKFKFCIFIFQSLWDLNVRYSEWCHVNCVLNPVRWIVWELILKVRPF